MYKDTEGIWYDSIMNPDQLFIPSRNNVPDSRLSTSIPTKGHHLYSSSKAPFVNSGVDPFNLTDANLEVSKHLSAGDKQVNLKTALKTSDIYATYL